jgi:hypothetical protein
MLDRQRRSESFPRLADRLLAASRRRLFGRERELGAFRQALAGRSAPFSVFHVHGLGGIGKSALLDACASQAAQAGVLAVRLDGRHIEPSPDGFLLAVREALRLGDTASPLDRLRTESAVVLTVDTYDALAPLDSWIRQTFVPQLPGRGVVVLAGRQPLSADWTADLTLGAITHVMALRNLSPEESRALLADRQVPPEQHDAVLRFTHGHPLALALVADVIAAGDPGVSFSPESAPNVVRELLSRLMATAPTSRHRRALETCAQVRVTTEPLLAAAIDDGDPHELFEWLRGLSLMECSAEGLFPHDLAREVLDADFRWRDPDGYLDVHRRVWRYLRQKLMTTSGRVQQRVFFDKLYLHRASDTGSRFHDYATLGSVYAHPPVDRDRAAIVETVSRWEGRESARIAAHWLERQPEAFRVARDARDEMLGFVTSLVLPDVSSSEAAVDPAVRGAWAFARRRGAPRPGEEMIHHRFHMACDCYQQVSPYINMLAMRATFASIEHRRLAWSFVVFSDADRWLPLIRYINFERAGEAAFTVGDREYAVFAHDWRAEPFEMWWDQLCERSLSTEPLGEDAPAPRVSSIVVLSESEFASCVRQALRDFTRPAALGGNPLLRSRVMADADGNHGSAAALQALLRDAVDALKRSPRDGKFHRALVSTYLDPAMTQECAAERLGLPFSTYRYHLARGIERVVDRLWEMELAGGR